MHEAPAIVQAVKNICVRQNGVIDLISEEQSLRNDPQIKYKELRVAHCANIISYRCSTSVKIIVELQISFSFSFFM